MNNKESKKKILNSILKLEILASEIGESDLRRALSEQIVNLRLEINDYSKDTPINEDTILTWNEFKTSVDKQLKNKNLTGNELIWYIDIVYPYENEFDITSDTLDGLIIS